jgi:hypothetical protein
MSLTSATLTYQVVTELIPVRADQLSLPSFKLIFNIWNELRGERFAPSWREIDLMEFPLDQVPRCVVVDVKPDQGEFIYRFWGTKVTDLHHQDLTGKCVRDLDPPEIAEVLHKQYHKTCDAKAPTLFVNHVSSLHGTMTEEVILRLPLSSDGENVNQIICAFDFGKDIDAYRKALEELSG